MRDFQTKIMKDQARFVKKIEELTRRVEALEDQCDRGRPSGLSSEAIDRLKQLKESNTA